MKKFIVVAVCLVLGMFLVSSMAMATDYSTKVTPGKGIKGTAHDLSLAGATSSGRTNLYGSNDTANKYLPGGDLDRICVWCHTPHFSLKAADAGAGYDYLPLWNHDVTAATFTMYTNGTAVINDKNHKLNADLTGQPGGVSKLCLSCHDGTVAVNSYGMVPSGTGAGDSKSSGVAKGDAPVFIDPNYKIGEAGDLSNHHPIGFDYVAVASVDDEIQIASAAFTTDASGATINTIGDLLWAGKMECTTCHDVHNTKNSGEKFLWKSDTQSALCLTCHLKADVKK